MRARRCPPNCSNSSATPAWTCTAAAPLNAFGRKGVQSIETAAADGHGGWRAQGSQRCDLLLVSGGWSPVVHLVSHRGIKPVWNAEQACFVAPEINEPIQVVGSAAGIWNTDACFDSGESAGVKAIKALGGKARAKKNARGRRLGNPIQPVYEVRVPGRKTKALVDPQHDVTTDDIRLAHREGFVSVEHLKRYTTLGMATDGGKVGNIIGIALMAEALGVEIPDVGTTTFRPPYTPVAIGALKGRNVDEHFRPLRRTPMHDWNLQNGATMTMAGLWHRPVFRPQRRNHQRGLRARNRNHARRGRPVRRYFARQDRGAGSGRHRVPEPGIHQPVRQAADRQGALRHHAAR